MENKELRLLDIVPVTAPGILSQTMIEDMTKYLMKTTQVEHVQIEDGPVTIESEYDEAFAAPSVVQLAEDTNRNQSFDGIFVNCFGDPGVRATREKLKTVVFGGFEPAMYLALGLGDSISIVTVLKNVVPMLTNAVQTAGIANRVTSIRTLDIPVLQLEQRSVLMTNLYRECKRAVVEDDASVIVMGCTGIVGIVEEMTTRLHQDGYDVPVLEAGQCAMLLTELYARLGVYPSRQTYMTPPSKTLE
ncbi:aspartate/glutamate racemase family protein [Lactiplantibacillus pentosus]|uniref:aspartate/glutamate racemase family protein n=1 Tax=Lactiplantibacillus pentosus TaxID=1589 RepID=UPI000B547819|nr:aspartate/glutamate racemase family protein [Lactiplantibacillus pentosus]ASG78427.1 hydrogenase expression protein HupH [Lactiplantibacillus pentosus]